MLIIFIGNMKNLSLITLLALFALSSSCTLKEAINPDGTLKKRDSTGTTNGGGGGGSTPSTTVPTGTTAISGSGSYFPMTKGSSWTYKAEGFGADTFTRTMLDTMMTVKGRTYVGYKNTSATYGDTGVEFYFYGSNLYLTRVSNDPTYALQDVPIFKDNAAVNASWALATEAGFLSSNARHLGTMKEKNITRVVNGKTYTNVCHTKIELQMAVSGVYLTTIVADYYFAQGVGMIDYIESVGGSQSERHSLISYTIK